MANATARFPSRSLDSIPAQASLGRRTAVPFILWPTWGPWILTAGSALILLLMPGTASLWTMEGRSAVICREMMRSGDYFHPYLFDDEYFDKPLVPYWLMIGAARLLGRLDETALRLPGILAALLAISWLRRIGTIRYGPTVGLTAGWLLTTTFCFAFWARVAGADILNLAAVVGAAAWFTERRDRPGFVTSAILFAILAVGSQMKGLVAPVMAVLVILPDLVQKRRWQLHLRPSLALALIPSLCLYLIPFLVSIAMAREGYASNGLGMVFKENIVRYFRPFDHKAPVYVYAEFLPLYLLPWTIFLPFVVWRAGRRWKDLGPDSRAPLIASLLLFVFLTLSGSRRNYYALPIIPFVLLAIADWLHQADSRPARRTIALWTGGLAATGLVLFFGAVAPRLWRQGGPRELAKEVRRTAGVVAPWSGWRVVLFNTSPQMGFYLDPAVPARRVTTEAALLLEVENHPWTIVVAPARLAGNLILQLPGCSGLPERSIIPGSRGEPLQSPTAHFAILVDEELKKIR